MTIGIMITVIAIIAITIQYIRIALLTKRFRNSDMYIDKYDRKKEEMETAIPIWGAMVILGICLIAVAVV